MISYIVLTLPWTAGRIITTPADQTQALKWRKIFAFTFFGSLVPLIYFFIQHKVQRIAGAYSIYAFFEWALIILDLSFDAVTMLDFKYLEIQIIDTKGVSLSTLTSDEKSLDNTSSSLKKKDSFNWFSFTIAILNSFFFWTSLTSLPLLIWHFPLWAMDISGFEAVLFGLVAPVFLAIKPLHRFLARYYQLVLWGGALAIGSYLIIDPTKRLVCTAAGCAFQAIALALQFSSASNAASSLPVIYQGTAFTLGLTASSIAKLAFWTNNPFWPLMRAETGGWNATGLTLAIIAGAFATTTKTRSLDSHKTKGGSAVAAAFGVAGLLFGLHQLLCDSTTLTLWVWEGYPVRGPLPVPHGGIITIAVMAAGSYLGVVFPEISGSFLFFAVGSIGAAVLYAFNEWTGYIGGLICGIQLIAVSPKILSIAGQHSPAKSFGLGFFILCIVYVLHVYVVAYAFVPFGSFLRERSDILLMLQQGFIGLSLMFGAGKVPGSSKNLKTSSSDSGLLAKFRQKVVLVVIILITISTAVTFQRFHRDAPQPYHAEDKVMTAGIWTVHFGLDNDMWASEKRMANVINELEIDVIGFLESDTQRAIMGFRDLTQEIAEELGYYADFGPGPNKHTWGCCLLSKFPILNSTHHLLPSPVGELAPAIHATLDVYGKNVDVVVFHSGQEEDVEDRRLQSLGVQEIMGSSSNPLVLLSYLVTRPLEGNYNTYVSEKSGMHDIDPTDWDRWCEYILYKHIKRVGYARVSRSTITDTEIQVGKFVIDDAHVDPESSTETRVDEGKVKEGYRFPALFRGEGVRGHRYHVFDEPRYFS